MTTVPEAASLAAHDFVRSERERQTAWKHSTSTLPYDARADAPYVDKRGSAEGQAYSFCLPREHARLNLLPLARDAAIRLFRELDIPWHAGVDGGPSNHLLSSLVQCVNALAALVHDPRRIALAFGSLLDMAEVLEVEPGRHLTFEYIGPTDYFGESPGRPRVRGARCTSVDAAFPLPRIGRPSRACARRVEVHRELSAGTRA